MRGPRGPGLPRGRAWPSAKLGGRPLPRRPRAPRAARAPRPGSSPGARTVAPAVPAAGHQGEEASPVATRRPGPHEDRARLGRGRARRPARPAPDALLSGGAAAGVPAAATCDGVTRRPQSTSAGTQLVTGLPAGVPACVRALGPWPGPTPQSCKAQRHRGTWLHQASLPSCLLLPQIRGRVPCCKLLTRTQGHRQPLSPPSPKHLPWAPSGPLTPHRPCQPWTPTSLDHEPRGLVGSGWQCGPPRPPDPRGRRSSWSGWVGAAGGVCPYILDVSAPLWGFEG